MLKELIAPVLFIALSVWVWFYSGGMPGGGGGVPGPAFFPRIIAAAIGLLGFFLLVMSFRSTKVEDEEDEPGSAAKTIIFIVLLLAYVALIQPLGFILSTFLFLLTAIQWMRREGIVMNVVFSAVAAGAVYGVFGMFLKVSLPALPFGL